MVTHYMDRNKDTSLNRTDTDYAWSALQLLGHDLSSVTSTNALGSFCKYLNAPSCSFISILRALLTSTNFCILFIRNFFFFEWGLCPQRSFFIILSYNYHIIPVLILHLYKYQILASGCALFYFSLWWMTSRTGCQTKAHKRDLNEALKGSILWLVNTIPILTLYNTFIKVQNVFLYKEEQNMVSWTSLVLDHRLYLEKSRPNKVTSFLFQGAKLEKKMFKAE